MKYLRGKIYKLEVYNKPNKVYIMLEDDNIALVNKNDYVFKGSIIGKIQKNNIYSSVSGKVVEIQETNVDDRNVKYIIIENDFKEKRARRIIEMDNLDYIEKLRSCGILENLNFIIPYTNLKINTLIINVEKYEGLIFQKIEEILETIDLILEISCINKAIIISKNKYLTNRINDYIGTYLNIEIKKSYKKDKVHETYIVDDIGLIYNIYEVLKYNVPITEKIISINNRNIVVKIGTKIKEIMKYLDIPDIIENDVIVN